VLTAQLALHRWRRGITSSNLRTIGADAGSFSNSELGILNSECSDRILKSKI